MNGGPGDHSPGDAAAGGAPIDFDRLDSIRDRLASDDRFETVEAQPDGIPARLTCVYHTNLYPVSIQAARLEIRWYRNGDVSLHYHEEHDDGSFDHRWDRHPSTHNTRDHIHPGPDAPTPGDDASHPTDWRDVLSTVLSEIETRQRAFWSKSP